MEESVGESGELSAGVEERLVAALSEGSMARMMGTLEKLKRLMSYYRCAIMVLAPSRAQPDRYHKVPPEIARKHTRKAQPPRLS